MKRLDDTIFHRKITFNFHCWRRLIQEQAYTLTLCLFVAATMQDNVVRYPLYMCNDQYWDNEHPSSICGSKLWLLLLLLLLLCPLIISSLPRQNEIWKIIALHHQLTFSSPLTFYCHLFQVHLSLVHPIVLLQPFMSILQVSLFQTYDSMACHSTTAPVFLGSRHLYTLFCHNQILH